MCDKVVTQMVHFVGIWHKMVKTENPVKSRLFAYFQGFPKPDDDFRSENAQTYQPVGFVAPPVTEL